MVVPLLQDIGDRVLGDASHTVRQEVDHRDPYPGASAQPQSGEPRAEGQPATAAYRDG